MNINNTIYIDTYEYNDNCYQLYIDIDPSYKGIPYLNFKTKNKYCRFTISYTPIYVFNNIYKDILNKEERIILSKLINMNQYKIINIWNQKELQNLIVQNLVDIKSVNFKWIFNVPEVYIFTLDEIYYGKDFQQNIFMPICVKNLSPHIWIKNLDNTYDIININTLESIRYNEINVYDYTIYEYICDTYTFKNIDNNFRKVIEKFLNKELEPNIIVKDLIKNNYIIENA